MTTPQLILNTTSNAYDCIGDWSIHTIEQLITPNIYADGTSIIINGDNITNFDSAGALVLLRLAETLSQNNVQWNGFNQHQQDLMALISKYLTTIATTPETPKSQNIIAKLGQETVQKYKQILGLVNLIGDLTDKVRKSCSQWNRLQVPSIITTIAASGITAMPIVGMLSFLIGVVLAYQMGLQLETYGASNFIAYLSGMAVFREFGPLITAIIVAGRTSSAFTAQIGSMKINEEIDAIYTMGLSPTELLVLPKLIGVLIVFPLLVFWADIFGILGAMIMSKSMLHINYDVYLIRLQDAVGFKQLALGLYKAPTFAILIALVGCFQGFRVDANADSVGRQTTRSVVQALFLIIITDAIYSVIYSKLNL